MTEETILSSRISSKFAGRSLMDFLTRRFQYQTREEWKRMIGRGKVTVNGKAITPDHLLKKNDIVAYSDVRSEPPVNINIQIIHEETFLIVINPATCRLILTVITSRI